MSSAARGESSTISLVSTRQQSPYTGSMYQFHPSLFHIPDHEFDIDDAEAKLFALMKSPHTIDGYNLVRHRVNTANTCNRKRTWTFICSHGKVMRKIDDRHFGPYSVGKINFSYQNVKRTELKRSIKGKFVLCFELCMNSFMLL